MPGARLTVEDRVRIETLFGQGLTFPQIAAAIGRHRSTVYREVRANNAYRGANTPGGVWHPRARRYRANRDGLDGAYRLRYSAKVAQVKSVERGQARVRARRLKLTHPPLRAVVVAMLRDLHSPQQVAGRLRRQHPDEQRMRVSHETIYQALYKAATRDGSLRGDVEVRGLLRGGRVQRRRRSRAEAAARHKGIKPWAVGHGLDKRSDLSSRRTPGHWEGDLVVGSKGSSAIITLVERTSRVVLLGALPESRTAQNVAAVVSDLLRRYPPELRRTLTWDQGSELATHETITAATGCRIFFADPHSPWQRGTNENTNGLLRQYFPRSTTNLKLVTQEQLDAVADQLNRRPRRLHAFRTPLEVLTEVQAATRRPTRRIRTHRHGRGRPPPLCTDHAPIRPAEHS